MSNMTWPQWFRRQIAGYPTPEAYLHAAAQYAQPLVESIRRLYPPPAKLLEMGCGIGGSARAFAAAGYDVLAVDRDPDILELASRLPTVPRLNYALGDELSAPGPADIVTCLGILEHYDAPERHQLLIRLRRCGAVLGLSIPTSWVNAGSREMDERDLTLRELIREVTAAHWPVREAFGWGIPTTFARVAGYCPPGILYRIQRRGRCCCTLGVVAGIGR